MQTSPSEFDGNELDWLAFRYVAGELSETEAAQFEERLAVDQVAREAVARSVELTGALSTVLSQSPEKPVLASEPAVNPSLKRSRWALLATVAALAMIASGLIWRQTRRSDVVLSDESLANAEQLMSLWSENESRLARSETASVAPPVKVANDHPANDERDEELVADAAADNLLPKLPRKENAKEREERLQDNDTVPEWMLAGVSLEADTELQTPEKGVR